jgi:hypothetical protein
MAYLRFLAAKRFHQNLLPHMYNGRVFKVPHWTSLRLTHSQSEILDVNVDELVQQWKDKKYDCKERIWDLKSKIRVNTYVSQVSDNNKVHEIPPHLLYVEAPAHAKALLAQTKTALDFLFSHILNVNSRFADMLHHEKNHYICSYKTRGLVYFPNNELHAYELHGRCASPDQFRAFLRSEPRLKVIDDFWNEYMELIVRHLAAPDNTNDSITEQQRIELTNIINQQGQLYLLKYSPGTGIWMHIDNLLRSDATVFTVGIGRDVVYDASKIVGRDKGLPASILRSHKPEGTMMALDGGSRYAWAHGIPYSYQKNKKTKTNNKTKYTILLRLFHHPKLSRCVGKCVELDVDMYTMLYD